METTRHIGIDLHRNKFTCCMRVENGRSYLLTSGRLADALRRPNSSANIRSASFDWQYAVQGP